MRRPLSLIIFFLLLSFGLAGIAGAANFTVTSTADSHDPTPGDGICGDPNLPDSLRCTLRAAIEETSALPGSDTIWFAPGLPILQLSLGTLIITGNGTVIDGRTTHPVLDGLTDPFYSSLMMLASDSNVVRNVTFQRARSHGVVVRGSYNCIGDSDGQTRTMFFNNGIDRTTSAAVYIVGSSAQWNIVVGCAVGIHANGEVSANQNGVAIDSSASNNRIGGGSNATRNYLCGNHGYGAIIAHGATRNQMRSCWMGPDASGTLGVGNGAGGILIGSGGTRNRVGGFSNADQNLISWNHGPGVTVSGSGSSFNAIAGNLIGLDFSGTIGIGNDVGVLISNGATDNTIGGVSSGDRNFITGNSGDGIRLSGNGTVGNLIIGNFIGTDTGGYYDLGNGFTSGHGVFVGEGAGQTQIGGASTDSVNVISGNPHAGICLSGSSHNLVRGNFIGVSVLSQSSCPNGTGILINNGSTDNTIGGAGPTEGNTISGNRAALFPNGVGVALLDPGTAYNTVIGNKIGTDVTGSRSLRNGSCGVLIGNGAQHNRIGGSAAGERNILAGNGAGSVQYNLGSGVHLFGEGTSYNQISGNYIGVGINGVDAVLNFGNGIALVDGASHNQIGGVTLADGNLIAQNPVHGILEQGGGTASNSFLNNRVVENDSLGIAVRVVGGLVPSPPLFTVATSGLVEGIQAPPLGRVQVYLAAADPSGSGEGAAIVGEGFADSTGSFNVPVSGLSGSDFVTAIATDTLGSSSAFALNRQVDSPTSAEDPLAHLPKRFGLEPNYPNPFNPSTEIRFSLPRACQAKLDVYNLQGELVRSLVNQNLPSGTYSISWNGRTGSGQRVASGVYFYRLTAGSFTASRKMVLLK
jgi:CSLREA domain-containing protein